VLRLLVVVVLVCIAAPACICGTQVRNQEFFCETDEPCVEGFVCDLRKNVCVRKEAYDAGPPDAGTDAGATDAKDAGEPDAGPQCSPTCINGNVCQGDTCACVIAGGTAQITETLCGDRKDNDCNGLTDCDDPSCAGSSCGSSGLTCEGTSCACSLDGGIVQANETFCDDNKDNDCDGLTDCQETICANQPCAPNGRVCQGPNCICGGGGGTAQAAETFCNDGKDNDCDGLIDCQEAACNGNPCGPNGFVCQGSCLCGGNGGLVQVNESSCNDGRDNDCDGLTDCQELTSCNGQTCGPNGQTCQAGACGCSGNGGVGQTAETICTDGKDNDCDGLIDCQEAACAGQSCGTGFTCQANACKCVVDGGVAGPNETSCSDNRDNDCNGLTDCQEAACNTLSCGTQGKICQGTTCGCSGNGGLAEAAETICNDGKDNDCDGLVDCQEAACAAQSCANNGKICQTGSCVCGGNGGTAQANESLCSDGIDNDCDGNVDCADATCPNQACAPNGKTCQGGACSCSGNGGTAQAAETNCNDGKDNDCDGLIDCQETACNTMGCGTNGKVCQGTTCGCSGNGGTAQAAETLCNDGKDNDCDGLIDCQEAACNGQSCGANGLVCQGTSCACAGNGGSPQAVESLCGDAHDNDCDGVNDCFDSSCANLTCAANGLVCQGTACVCGGNGGTLEGSESICTDGHDNDCNGLTDCAENACSADPSCTACKVNVSTAKTGVGGRGELVELGGTPRLIFSGNGTGSSVQYAECTGGCTTSTPTWASVALASSINISRCRAHLGVQGTTLVAAWRSSVDNVYYSECPGNCTSLASWTTATVHAANGGSNSFGADFGTSVRALAYEAPGPLAAYSECSANCIAPASWATVTFNFDPASAAVAVSKVDGRRAAVYATGSVIKYTECASNCTSAASWSTPIDLPNGYVATVVIDAQNLPRVFYNIASYGTGGVRMNRCTTRPCTTLGNWATTGLTTVDGFVTVGTAVDGGTWFLTNAAAGAITAGTETGSGYTQKTLIDCAGSSANTSGIFPTGYLSPQGKWRVSFANPTSPYGPTRYFYEGP
jgi:hypothetical protein